LRVEHGVLPVGLGAALVGVGVVAGVAQLEEARRDAGHAALDPVDDLGDLAQVVRGALPDRVIAVAERRAVLLVALVERGIALAADERRLRTRADVLLGRLGARARPGAV